MTLAIFQIHKLGANGYVRRFHLSAPQSLKDRIFNVAHHERGKPALTMDSYGIIEAYGQECEAIPLHKLLSWIKSSGYSLNSAMAGNMGAPYISTTHDQYIFDLRDSL